MMSFTRRQAAGLVALAAATAVRPALAWQGTPTSAAPDPAAPDSAAPDSATPLADDDMPTTVATEGNPFVRMTAPVYINGQGPFPFVIDTGANISCVSHRLAAQLGLEAAAPTPVHSVVGVRNRPTVMIRELKVGERNRRRVRAPSLPIRDTELAGVLGVDWLKGQRLELGIKDNQLEITRSKPDFDKENSVLVPARQRWGQLTIVDAEVSGRKIQVLIDSGSQISICNDKMFALVNEAEGKRAAKSKAIMVRLETIMGEPFMGEMIYLPFMRLGGLRLANVPVVHAETHVFDAWGVKTKPAVVLGMDLLSEFRRVALDFGASTVRFDI